MVYYEEAKEAVGCNYRLACKGHGFFDHSLTWKEDVLSICMFDFVMYVSRQKRKKL